MAKINPFKAVRYNKNNNLADCLTQPYDKISPKLKKDYQSRSPNNLVNVLKPDDCENKYAKSGEIFRNWLSNGTLVQDNDSGFYPYRQTFDVDGEQHIRSGFIGLCKVEDYSKRIVFPHEKTLTGPKIDRLSLLREGKVHYGLIFLLYEDDGKAQKVIDSCMVAAPDVSAKDDFDVKNELWQLNDSEKVKNIQNALADKELFIADGHHRYETSLAYSKENPDNDSAQFTLAMFININSPLVVLPTHRVVRNIENYSATKLRESLSKSFVIEHLATVEQTIAATKSNDDQICIGCFDGEDFWSATLKNNEKMKEIAPEKSDDWRELDVAVLHSLIIENALGISPEKVANDNAVSYHRAPQGAVDKVKSGDGNCAFFLKSTKPEQVCNVARNGEVMPQKSTDFYPKVLSGLAMYMLD